MRSPSQPARDYRHPTNMQYVSWLWTSQYHIAILGTIAAFVLAWIVTQGGAKIVNAKVQSDRERFRLRQSLNTFVLVAFVVVVGLLWARKLQHTSTFLGLIGAGLAVALREPLLSIAGRIAIFAGHIYSVGDRIQLEKMSGDVIGVGFFYTRMMEIGNWIGGDQYSGRIIQFANATIFGTAVMNYTQDFAYIWDEVKLPVTYESNFRVATQILTDVGGEYTKEFLEGAQHQLDRMRHYFLIPETDLKPQVFTKVTDNYLQLTMRYVVDPKKRRSASSFIYAKVFERLQQRDDVQIGSQTISVTLGESNDLKRVLDGGHESNGRPEHRAA